MPEVLWRPGQSLRNGAWALLALLLACAAASSLTEAAASDSITPAKHTQNEAKAVPTNIRNLLLWILQNDGVVSTSSNPLLALMSSHTVTAEQQRWLAAWPGHFQGHTIHENPLQSHS